MFFQQHLFIHCPYILESNHIYVMQYEIVSDYNAIWFRFVSMFLHFLIVQYVYIFVTVFPCAIYWVDLCFSDVFFYPCSSPCFSSFLFLFVIMWDSLYVGSMYSLFLFFFLPFSYLLCVSLYIGSSVSISFISYPHLSCFF